ASEIILCDLQPRISTTKPTPQASCSNHGSYSPCLGGRPGDRTGAALGGWLSQGAWFMAAEVGKSWGNCWKPMCVEQKKGRLDQCESGPWKYYVRSALSAFD